VGYISKAFPKLNYWDNNSGIHLTW
jgi:hypothetical protein